MRKPLICGKRSRAAGFGLLRESEDSALGLMDEVQKQGSSIL